MELKLEGNLLIYARNKQGRVMSITRQNTLHYSARNIMVDLIAGVATQPVKCMTFGNRALSIPTDEIREAVFNTSYCVYADTSPSPNPAAILLDVPTQVVTTGSPPTPKDIYNTKTVTYSPIVSAESGASQVTFQTIIPPEVVKITMSGGLPDPTIDENYAGSIFMWSNYYWLPTARVFSVAKLAQPLLLNPDYEYTLQYTYKIK